MDANTYQHDGWAEQEPGVYIRQIEEPQLVEEWYPDHDPFAEYTGYLMACYHLGRA